jgi:hypothetical protein
MAGKAALNHIDNFCNSSSIHGFPFLNKKEGRTCPDRLIWAVALILSLVCCAWLLKDMSDDWNNNPVDNLINNHS